MKAIPSAPRHTAPSAPSGQPASPAKRRATLRLALPAFLCGALGVFTACESTPESHLVTAPPPANPTLQVPATTQAVVVTTPVATAVPVAVTTAGATVAVAPVATTVGATYVVAQTPPAPPPPEAIPARPSMTHLWVPGYWTWRNERYEWMSGHWEVPPSSGAVWIAPHWEPENGSYRFYEGYWR